MAELGKSMVGPLSKKQLRQLGLSYGNEFWWHTYRGTEHIIYKSESSFYAIAVGCLEEFVRPEPKANGLISYEADVLEFALLNALAFEVFRKYDGVTLKYQAYSDARTNSVIYRVGFEHGVRGVRTLLIVLKRFIDATRSRKFKKLLTEKVSDVESWMTVSVGRIVEGKRK